jgi:long-chain acyl-CoA synthetase
MPGYYRRPDLTAQVIDADGWFHTGDLGRVDQDGFLYLTGRIKNMIGLAGGKKVYPEEVESVFRKSLLFKDVCVLGTKWKEGLLAGTEQVTALVVLNANAGPEIVEAEVRRLGADLSPFKRPTRIEIYPHDFPATAAKKVKRDLLLEWMERRP